MNYSPHKKRKQKSDILTPHSLNIDRAVAASLMNPKLLPAASISN